jgi:hypothetical protein
MTIKQMRDYDVVLMSEKGDMIWRFFDGTDGRPRWKVWVVEPTSRIQIKNWQETRQGAAYYKGAKFIGNDFIIPKKYLIRTAKLLGLDLKKNAPRNLTEAERKAREAFIKNYSKIKG